MISIEIKTDVNNTNLLMHFCVFNGKANYVRFVAYRSKYKTEEKRLALESNLATNVNIKRGSSVFGRFNKYICIMYIITIIFPFHFTIFNMLNMQMPKYVPLLQFQAIDFVHKTCARISSFVMMFQWFS